VKRWFVGILSLAVLLTLIRAAGFREVAGIWTTIRPEGIAVAAAAYFAAIGVRVVSWRLLLGAESPRIRALAPPLALGFLLGHVTPAKSGEPAAAVLVSRTFGIALPRTLSVLTAERALQLVALLLTFLPAAALHAHLVPPLHGALRAGAVLLAPAVVAAVLAGPALRALRPWLLRIPRIGPAAGEYVDALAAVLADRRRTGPLLALGVLFWMLQYGSLWAILDAGGASVNLPGAATVAGTAVLGGTLSMIPLGTQDGISAVVLAGLGVPMARGFSLALFHTVLSLLCGLALLVVLPLLVKARS
jgi:uncharacterized membrane protein YbhN (UPF0104 family)